MFFGSVPINQAAGSILAHSYLSKQGRIRKGQVLTKEQVAIMRHEGVTQLTVARLSADDIHEDLAASALAEALAGDQIRVGEAATGRVNLYACSDGLLVFNADEIQRVNAVDENITLATRLPDERVQAGQKIATIKIIAYGVNQAALADSVGAIHDKIAVHPMRSSTACLIQTRLPVLKDKVLDKSQAVIVDRLSERQGRVLSEWRPEHTVDGVMEALESARASQPDWILIFGASAISDRNDTIPAAIVNSGGVIEHFGMPMDPGNLLLLGRLGNTVVIGMPGCARSASYNGLDRVLDRLACDVPVTRSWITSLGVGGLVGGVAR